MSEADDEQTVSTPAAAPHRPGRKLDVARNAKILDSALEVLAETGYEGMTIDMVAAHSGSARATVYRRWTTKADLVVDAVRHMSASDTAQLTLPDTGTLRGDLIAAIIPLSVEDQERRIKVLAGLATLAKTEPRLAGIGGGAGIEPWVDAARVLLQRSIDRGEYPGADVGTLALVMPMMSICRAAVQQQPITPEFTLSLIDSVILPAMRGAQLT
ncbi:TetR/AcrR family transcriptional regulator [Actinoplanes palleronii]|uniref:TetR family transcriptional regulator n=1 Tax=Actinoplanes palleronii TaxID=113570 RepID=A0ABQ4BPS2_9ACTN|nr:TetR/AcrR family transcriptional regulator [Actinoplanes palleronii]GIE72664.1 TetR family transcriptional regulator [Actinoplanes palleronii]